ncbi:MAG TPA: hypothetical protein VMU84_18600 [Thermoanaerobaculia bacterium]|nr:hypothetical protein [Thermoanaerobaculia bacterium]
MRSRGENLRSVFVLAFLTIALFILETRDTAKYARVFSFDRNAVASGEVWRVVTWQFTQVAKVPLDFPRPIVFFVSLLLLLLMGSAVEEEWGTRRFLTLFFVSTFASAGIAAILGVPLLGSYFVNFSLLFVYASLFPHRWFRMAAVGVGILLVVVVVGGGASNLAALAGAVASYIYYLLQRPLIQIIERVEEDPDDTRPPLDHVAMQNAARFVAIKQALAARSTANIERLVDQCEREVVAGVNICPPADYKPEHNDGYCIRCEGFAECSARYLNLNRPKILATEGTPVTDATA